MNTTFTNNIHSQSIKTTFQCQWLWCPHCWYRPAYQSFPSLWHSVLLTQLLLEDDDGDTIHHHSHPRDHRPQHRGGVPQRELPQHSPQWLLQHFWTRLSRVRLVITTDLMDICCYLTFLLQRFCWLQCNDEPVWWWCSCYGQGNVQTRTCRKSKANWKRFR